MTSPARDQNGRRIYKHVRQEADGTWSANVWSGTGTRANPAQNVMRFGGYLTRKDALSADIADFEKPGIRVISTYSRVCQLPRTRA